MGVYALESQYQQDAAVKGNPSILIKNQSTEGGSSGTTLPDYYYSGSSRHDVNGAEKTTFSSDGLKVWQGQMPPSICPPGWTQVPPGWCLLVESAPNVIGNIKKIVADVDGDGEAPSASTPPTSDLAAPSPLPSLPVQKVFSFKSQNAMYIWLGKVGWFADRLGVVPTIEWMCTEATVTIRPQLNDGDVIPGGQLPLEAVPDAEREVLVSRSQLVAEYMNDAESQFGVVGSNMSQGTSVSTRRWNPKLDNKATVFAQETFCWLNEKQTVKFSQETGMQWGNRADYLVARYSRQKKEFRKDLTLGKVIQEGKERRRRMERKKIKEVVKTSMKQEMDIPEGLDERELDNFTFSDTIPRDLREQMDHDAFSSDPYAHKPRTGMEAGDSQYSRITSR